LTADAVDSAGAADAVNGVNAVSAMSAVSSAAPMASGLSISSCTVTAATGQRSVVSTNARAGADPAPEHFQ